MSTPINAPMIDFYFDCSSPWTYLAFHNIQPLARECAATICWKPVLVGGIFNAVNPSVYAQRDNPIPAKRDYMLKDLQDWAREAGLRITMPPSVFPVNSVKVMRACIWLLEQKPAVFLPFATAVFEAYWGDDLDISQDSVIAGIADRCGLDAPELFQAVSTPDIKDALKANTEEVMRRGGFGSPTMFVGHDMFFGNDRLPLVRSALLRASDQPASAP
jgi:2-hydroxychromene-2-carboxylate isomerase